MNILRIISACIVATIFDVIYAGSTCGWLFNWVYSLDPTCVWKPMEGPPGIEVHIGTLLLNFLFVYIFVYISKGFPSTNKYFKGLLFGLGVWVVGMLPGMFATHCFMTVANQVVIYWTISALIQLPLKGLIVAAIYKDKS